MMILAIQLISVENEIAMLRAGGLTSCLLQASLDC